MINTIYQTRGPYYFGTGVTLTPENADRLIGQFTTACHGDGGSVLGGRQAICITVLEGLGSVVVKHYRRGGMLARLNKRTYVKRGKPRCQLEFEQMAFARSIGVSTPEPVAFAYRGDFLYQAWLVTKEITGQCSLAVLSIQNPHRAKSLLPALAEQVATLIEHKILHADFHPGNVLVDNRDQIFIIDFDKARIFAGSRHKLKARYVQRWRRAVHKHRLPKMLDDQLGALLQAL